jgi:hypothetical protein
VETFQEAGLSAPHAKPAAPLMRQRKRCLAGSDPPGATRFDAAAHARPEPG